MAVNEQKKAAKAFAQFWKDKGYEKGQSQQYWNMLLRTVFNIDQPEKFIEYEDQVMMDKSNGFIDGYIPSTKVLIEQKSIEKDLNKAIKQSDGSLLTPFQQAKKYIVEMPVSKHPKWVVTCNFKDIYIYNMETPHGEPEIIHLKDLEKEYYRLQFLVDDENEHIKREMEISFKAGEIVGELYDAFAKQYVDLTNKHSIESLNKLCVRIVFCLYAEDAGLFKHKSQFHDYLSAYTVNTMRQALIDLFKILDTKEDERDPYLDEKILDFPYVNGGLFTDENIEIPRITEEIKTLLLAKASDDFDWSEISPTIFGAVFESTLNPETRRKGGMHYTSIENIHKVIDPLFLDDLKAELEEIKHLKQEHAIQRRASEFQDKLSKLTFFDPAAGSGNFLTETYISLRKLENEAIRFQSKGIMSLFDPVKVQISQFYGIEINDFAVSVAQTALWIAESQMKKETEELFNINLEYLPLKSFSNIVCDNALRIDWNNVVSSENVNYIMGNPPFIGVNYMSDTQREEMDIICVGIKRGKLDYVACWYIKATEYIKGTNIKVALVSTNSITQGEQAIVLWNKLFTEGVIINFAHRTFQWDSEASIKAHVHCVIVGFTVASDNSKKWIFDNGRKTLANNINAYLLDAPSVFIEEHSKPICAVTPITRGSQATDDGLYLFSREEKDDFIKKEPNAAKYIKQFMMGREFINGIERYCLWMPNISPNELRSMPKVLERVQAVKKLREESKNEQTRNSALLPWRFGQYREPSKQYIAFAKVSSQRRRYIPFGFLTDDIIPGDKLFTIPNATLFDFGVLTSNVHMAWMRTVCGRLKSDYSYSTTIVYNTFPWPDLDERQRKRIENTAQSILDARSLYPDSCLADLYDEVTMPPELRKAHQENDKAVMEAYGFTKVVDGKRTWLSESETVAELMKMYEKLVG